MAAKFELGRIVSTPGAMDAMMDIDVEAIKALPQGWDFISTSQMLLERHASGDWGDLSDDDKAKNNTALTIGPHADWGDESLMSVYKLFDTLTVWIITESDRSVTTILLPEEY